jgi:hypothetical protein
VEGCLFPAERAHVFWNGTFTESQKDAMLKDCLPGAFDQHLAQMDESASLRVRTSWNASCSSISAITWRTTSW